MTVALQLKTWIQTLLKSRDAMHQAITSFEDTPSGFIVHKKIGDHLFFIRADIVNVSELTQKTTTPITIIALNTRKNVNFVISHWELLSKIKQLTIYFVHPTKNEKWILAPYTHNQITEKIALRKGLEALFSEVPTWS